MLSLDDSMMGETYVIQESVVFTDARALGRAREPRISVPFAYPAFHRERPSQIHWMVDSC